MSYLELAKQVRTHEGGGLRRHCETCTWLESRGVGVLACAQCGYLAGRSRRLRRVTPNRCTPLPSERHDA